MGRQAALLRPHTRARTREDGLAAQLAASGLSTSSVRNALAPVRALLATALKEGLIRSNPAAGLRIAQRIDTHAAEERAKALTEEQLRELLAEIPDDWRLFFEILTHTGLGVAQLSRLTYSASATLMVLLAYVPGGEV